ncbi:MAG: hypothetical protein F4X65_04340 [Chloroflexi bacterium]|nr:hypothetical protein [Chloroflexota bacterium]
MLSRSPSLSRPLALSVASFLLLVLFLLPLLKPSQLADAQSSVTEPTVSSSSRSPAAVSGYVVKFTTTDSENAVLQPFEDSISMELHEDIRVPRGINPATVRVQYTNGNGTRSGTATNIELTDHTDPRRPTVVTIYPAIRESRDAPPGPIPHNSMVTVTFTKNAGIRNPTEGGAYSWKVWTSKDTNRVPASHANECPSGGEDCENGLLHAYSESSPDDVSAGLLVDREIQLSKEEAGRGEQITVIGRGYKNGTTLTVWRDADADGNFDSDESSLCDTMVLANDIGYCSFTVSVPPFTHGTGECDSSENAGGVTCEPDYNLINARDGYGGTSVIYAESGKVSEVAHVLELVGSVKASNVQGPGGNIQVQLTDFPEGFISSVDIGGVLVDIDRLRVGPSGSLYFSIAVPNEARLGRQSLQVVLKRDNGEETYSRSVVVVITHPTTTVRIFPETVLPNQRVSLWGNGFSDGNDVSIEQVRVDGFDLGPARINGGSGSIELSRDGSWSGSLDLPIVEATTAEGVHSLRVEDSRGLFGTVEFNVPPREVKVSPVWGRPGSLVTVEGTGFPVRNDNGSSISILIRYESQAGVTLTSAHADASGSFSQEVLVPLRTPLPSSNFIRVEFEDDQGKSVITTARHEVPAATVVLDPVSGPPGTPVTITGSGFRRYARVDTLTIGTIDVSPGTSLSTDADGEFEARFLAPGIGQGRQTVIAAVAGVTASVSFEIKQSGVPPGGETPVSTALEDLSDNVVAIFHFNDDTKTWSFYEPGYEDFGDLRHMITGESYWIQVRSTAEAVLNGKTRRLTCLSGNCWNHVVW